MPLQRNVIWLLLKNGSFVIRHTTLMPFTLVLIEIYLMSWWLTLRIKVSPHYHIIPPKLLPCCCITFLQLVMLIWFILFFIHWLFSFTYHKVSRNFAIFCDVVQYGSDKISDRWKQICIFLTRKREDTSTFYGN